MFIIKLQKSAIRFRMHPFGFTTISTKKRQ